MSESTGVKAFIKQAQIFNYNVLNRDAWIANQAKLLPQGTRILDAGAGSCPYRDFFDHCEYKAQDFASLSNEQLSGGKYGQIDYVCDIASIPVPDASFDAILCSEVLEHLPEPVSVIQEFFRILKPGGKLILTAPLGSGIHQEPYHFYGGYTPYWYQKFLGDTGLEEINIEANCGSLKACGQETLRFIRLSHPFKLGLPFWAKLAWTPIWILLAPFLGIAVPVAAHFLDHFDKEQRFTIGYHITATKRAKGHSSL